MQQLDNESIWQKALSHFVDGTRVFVHGQSAVPMVLLEKILQALNNTRDLVFLHLHVEGRPAHLDPMYSRRCQIQNLFVAPSVRPLVDFDRVDYIPVFLSEIPRLIKSKRCSINVALIHVSPPNRFGYCNLGVGVDIAKAAIESAEIVIAQVNSQMPVVHGDGWISCDKISYFLPSEQTLPTTNLANATNPITEKIGQNVAALVDEGATLQLGIGSVPDAVLAQLKSHRNLGIHSEMFSDGIIDLIKSGVINNSQKKVHPGKSVASFLQGSQRLYDFVNDNPAISLFPSDYVNSPVVIARNPKVTAINSAVEVDLTGQVCADSVGHRMISGVGGQVDFMRGAALCPDGKPIIAMSSRSAKGQARIVSELKAGSGVVTTRADVHFVVTEYGAADLYGKSLGDRAKALIGVAHPDDREELNRAWHRIKASKSII